MAVQLGSRRRPTLGGIDFRLTYLAAVGLGRIHPRLARRALLRLWFTTWVHPAVRRPVADVPDGLEPWTLRVGGTTLRGYAGGSGPTAVLVHGWSGRAADWRHLAAALVGAGWRVVVPDLPAHGMTRGRRTDLFVLAGATAAVLGQERPAAVVTHSMGYPTTMLALEEGAPSPNRIVAIAPGRKILHAVDGFTQRARLPDDLVDELIRGIERAYGSDVWDVLDVDRLLARLTVGGLVIHDADDDEVPLSDARHIAARWPSAELVRTAGLGHRRILRDEAVRELVVRSVTGERQDELASAAS